MSEIKHTSTPWTIYLCPFADEDGGKSACGFNGYSLDQSYDECHHPLLMEDAKFIVKAVNEYELLIKENARLRDALDKYGRHFGECVINNRGIIGQLKVMSELCSCGFRNALAQSKSE